MEQAHNTKIQRKQFLTFKVGKELYGVDITKVVEIRGWQNTTHIPESPEYMKGVVDLRGNIVPIFDLLKKFTDIATEITSAKVFIVLNLSGKIVGVLVDSVSDIVTTNDGDIKSVPSSGNSQLDSTYMKGILSDKNGMTVLLDIEKLFGVEVIEKATSN